MDVILVEGFFDTCLSRKLDINLHVTLPSPQYPLQKLWV